VKEVYRERKRNKASAASQCHSEAEEFVYIALRRHEVKLAVDLRNNYKHSDTANLRQGS